MPPIDLRDEITKRAGKAQRDLLTQYPEVLSSFQRHPLALAIVTGFTASALGVTGLFIYLGVTAPNWDAATDLLSKLVPTLGAIWGTPLGFVLGYYFPRAEDRRRGRQS